MNMQFALLLIAGTAGGLLFAVLHIPGGMMFGAVLAVLALKLAGNVDIHIPPLFHACSQIAIGIVVGNMLTSQMLVEIRNMAGLMILSTAILVCGRLYFRLLHFTADRMDPGSAILATSPGGLQRWSGWPPIWARGLRWSWPSRWYVCMPSCFWLPLISWLLGHFLK